MKAILMSIKPKWVAKILNGEKTIEIRKNKALASAIQKLINENGYADIYVYCSKDDDLGCIKKTSKDKYVCGKEFDINDFDYLASGYNGKGKVVFKFCCYKVEEIPIWKSYWYANKKTCLSEEEIKKYLDVYFELDVCRIVGYAIHINDLEIFDRPKELSEFYKFGYLKEKIKFGKEIEELKNISIVPDKYYVEVNYRIIDKSFRLTKAPQNFYYVEVEK